MEPKINRIKKSGGKHQKPVHRRAEPNPEEIERHLHEAKTVKMEPILVGARYWGSAESEFANAIGDENDPQTKKLMSRRYKDLTIQVKDLGHEEREQVLLEEITKWEKKRSANEGGKMLLPIGSTLLVLRNTEERTITRDQIWKGMASFDKDKRGVVSDEHKGWFVKENEQCYPPKLLLRLATGFPLSSFTGFQARNSLRALGFDVREVDVDDPPEGGEEDSGATKGEQVEEAIKTTFVIERHLQGALRANIEQLEPGLKITDGGKEQVVDSGRIDITTIDKNGVTVVIELKAGEAGRHAVGQIAAYMGDLTDGKKQVRGILVAGEFSPKAVSSARVVPGLRLRKYNIKFAFEPTGSS
jgi:hypothetical protein